MEFERDPEQKATDDLHTAILNASDPTLTFSDRQKESLQISLAMLKQTVALATEAAQPSFKDYISARIHAGATGSVAATFNGTAYTKADASHDIRDCDEDLAFKRCSKCMQDYRRLYGYRQAPRSVEVTNTATGDITGTLIQGGNIGQVRL